MAVRHRHDFYFLRTERLKAHNKIDFDTRTTEHNSICTYINRINGCPRQRIYTDSQPPPSNPKGKCLKRTSFVVVSISKLFSNPPTLSNGLITTVGEVEVLKRGTTAHCKPPKY